MKILIVEDNEDSRILLVKQLRAHGHEVMAAVDGAEALEQALAQPPNIIVSDILMPKMDGYLLCYEWKQNDNLRDIPFVFYTATYTSDEDEEFAVTMGASAFIRKPTAPDALVQTLSEIIEKVQSGALAPAEVAPLEISLFLTEYNKRIIAKLWQTIANFEMEITKRKLEQEEHTKQLNDALEEADTGVLALNKELDDRNRQLEEMSLHKSQFLANMSHELRTPLNSIIGYTKLMADGLAGDINEKQEKFLHIVYRNSKDLLELINGLLDLSRIEAGKTVLSYETFAIPDLLAEVIPGMEQPAREKGLVLTYSVAPDIDSLYADRAKVRQVLLNILGNAIKFTSEGSVKLDVTETDGDFIFSVADTGMGIKKDDLAVIFDSFKQVGPAQIAGYEGTGLGLTISQHYIEMQGGRIWAESEPGKGSTFTFALPRKRVASS